MINSQRVLYINKALTWLLMLTASSVALAEITGTIKTSKGTASIERNGQKLPASVGASVEAKDRILSARNFR